MKYPVSMSAHPEFPHKAPGSQRRCQQHQKPYWHVCEGVDECACFVAVIRAAPIPEAPAFTKHKPVRRTGDDATVPHLENAPIKPWTHKDLASAGPGVMEAVPPGQVETFEVRPAPHQQQEDGQTQAQEAEDPPDDRFFLWTIGCGWAPFPSRPPVEGDGRYDHRGQYNPPEHGRKEPSRRPARRYEQLAQDTDANSCQHCSRQACSQCSPEPVCPSHLSPNALCTCLCRLRQHTVMPSSYACGLCSWPPKGRD